MLADDSAALDGRIDLEELELVEIAHRGDRATANEEDRARAARSFAQLVGDTLLGLSQQRMEHLVYSQLHLERRVRPLRSKEGDARDGAVDQMGLCGLSEARREVRDDGLLVHRTLTREVELVVLPNAHREGGLELVPAQIDLDFVELLIDLDGVGIGVLHHVAHAANHVAEDERSDEEGGEGESALRVIGWDDVTVADGRERGERPVDRVQIVDPRACINAGAIIVRREPCDGLAVRRGGGGGGSEPVPSAADDVCEVAEGEDEL